jgi:hypothetical protein
VLEYERTGIVVDDKQTVADYLMKWLRAKGLVLKSTTIANYHAYAHKDLIPRLGTIRLEDLSHHQHVELFVHDQLASGRGHVTLRRCIATLSSALGDAVRQHRLAHNAAEYTSISRPTKYEPVCWSPTEAARFLKYCADQNDPLSDLFERIFRSRAAAQPGDQHRGPAARPDRLQSAVHVRAALVRRVQPRRELPHGQRRRCDRPDRHHAAQPDPSR